MERSRRDLSNDMAEHRSFLTNNQNTYSPRFSFTPKTGVSFLLCNIFLFFKVFNRNQCPIRVAHIDESPFIRFPLQGRLSYVIREIARRMNASIEPMSPESGGGGKLCGPGEQTGTRGMVVRISF